MIAVPDLARTLPVIASVSGGKDSTALILALREAEVPARNVFADTKWESPETYAYLDTLRSILGITIDVVTNGGMVERARTRAGFPSRMARWCTEELKLKPLKAYHDAIGDDTITAVGVRGEESAKRAQMPEWADDDDWGGWVWRPLIRWTIADVLAIHHRHGVPVNPLYKRGHNRVGCYPCIFSQKEEVRLIADHSPERIDEIRALEAELSASKVIRNAEAVEAGAEKVRYKNLNSTFFQSVADGKVTYIDEVVKWSRTSRGGKQLQLLPDPPQGGCMRWGMCEAEPKEPT